MVVIRLFLLGILLARETPPRGPVRRVPYDAATLATRPLPTDLRLYQHPREISPERVREITRGRME